MRQSLDLLGGAKYKNEVLKFKNYGIGLFAETFGDAFPVVKELLAKGCEYVRIQLIWSDTHSFGDNDIPTIKKLAAKYNKLALEYPARIIELSPFCEHNLSNPDKYLDICQIAAPACTIVNTPWKGSFSKKYKNEIHGDHAKPQGRYNYSYDGTNAVDSDVEAMLEKHKDAEAFFMWNPRFNLKWSMKDTTPRPQRKAIPSNDVIKANTALFGQKQPYSIPKGWLVKPMAEKHDAQDKKGDKLLIISPVNASKIVLKKGSNVVATLPLYGSFSGGGWRYYWNQFAYKLGSNIDVFIGSKKYGTITPAFRSPPYRD